MTDVADWVLAWRLAATRRFANQSQPALLAWTMFPLAVVVPVLFLNLGRIADFAGSRLTSGLLVGAVVMALTCLLGSLGTGLTNANTAAAAVGGALIVALCQGLAEHYDAESRTATAAAAVSPAPEPVAPTVSPALLADRPAPTDPDSCHPRAARGSSEAEAATCTAGDGRFEMTLVRYESAAAMGQAFRARRTTTAGWRHNRWSYERDPSKTYRGRWEHKATTTRSVLVAYDHTNLTMATLTDSRPDRARLELWHWYWGN